MATHYCPECGDFSYHGNGSAPWALKCPSCGAVAAQQPHPPAEPTGRARPKRQATAPRPRSPKSGAGKRTATAPRPAVTGDGDGPDA